MTDEPKKDSRSRFRAMLGEGDEKKQPEKKSSLLTRLPKKSDAATFLPGGDRCNSCTILQTCETPRSTSAEACFRFTGNSTQFWPSLLDNYRHHVTAGKRGAHRDITWFVDEYGRS